MDRKTVAGVLPGRFPQKIKAEHTRDEWLALIQRTGMVCHYCRCDLTVAMLTKDHLTPLCRGGSDKISNIVPACAPCNQMKSWRTEEEFFRDREMLLKKRTEFDGLIKPKPLRRSLEEDNEPGLLKTLVHEREMRRSWWRSRP